MNFFDTNILTAASITAHPDHQVCNERLGQIRKAGAACAAHSLAEAYSTFTRMPMPYRVSPSDALRIVQHTSETCTLVSLTAVETLRTIREIAERGLGGGLIYDALLLACARKIGAKRIYTNNQKHFRRIAPDLASRIFEP
ncbi:MAG TPA: PIN domain-containing protein [Edaphobacter sp.]|nr:PIN domain-containing protein [Edaphobacter sp.]